MGIIVAKITFREDEIPLSQVKRKDLRLARVTVNLSKGAISGFSFSPKQVNFLKKHVLLKFFLSSHQSALTDSKGLSINAL